MSSTPVGTAPAAAATKVAPETGAANAATPTAAAVATAAASQPQAQAPAQPMPAAVASPSASAGAANATANGAATPSAVNGVSGSAPAGAAAVSPVSASAGTSVSAASASAATDKDKSSEKEGDKANGEKKTLFVSGIPVDVRPREVHNFFRFLPGFVSAVLSTKSRAPVAFVTFATPAEAVSAQTVLTGQYFDLDSSVTLRLEFARAATHATNAAAAPAATAAAPKKRGDRSGDDKRVRPSAYSHMTFPGQPYPQPVPVQQPPLRITAQPAAAAAPSPAAPGGANGAAGKVPCATLFVANLPANTTEQSLTKLFSAVAGFRRCKLTAKNAGSAVAFVEFADVTTSSAALSAFQDYRLNGTGDKHGLRIEYAKASMGLPSSKQLHPQHAAAPKADAQAAVQVDPQAQAAAAAAAAAAGYAAADPNAASAYAAYAAAAHASQHTQFNPLLGGALPQAVYARPY